VQAHGSFAGVWNRKSSEIVIIRGDVGVSCHKCLFPAKSLEGVCSYHWVDCIWPSGRHGVIYLESLMFSTICNVLLT
jgi:hypothetical protein